VTAYQGFILDITERSKQSRNTAAQPRTSSVEFDCPDADRIARLSDSLHRTLRQMAELFKLMQLRCIYLTRKGRSCGESQRWGHRSEYSRHFPPVSVKPELMQHIRAVHATFLSMQGLPLPPVFREAQLRKNW